MGSNDYIENESDEDVSEGVMRYSFSRDDQHSVSILSSGLIDEDKLSRYFDSIMAC